MTGVGFWDFALGAPLVGAGFSFGFVVVRWFANFIAGRLDRKEDRIDAGTQRLIGQLQEQVRELIDHKRIVEDRLEECLRRDIEKERRIAQLEGLTAGFGDARQHAQLIVSADKAKNKRDGE